MTREHCRHCNESFRDNDHGTALDHLADHMNDEHGDILALALSPREATDA